VREGLSQQEQTNDGAVWFVPTWQSSVALFVCFQWLINSTAGTGLFYVLLPKQTVMSSNPAAFLLRRKNDQV
jgi:hypothetical protein